MRAGEGGGLLEDYVVGGEGGIRTHDPLRDTAFRERRLKPLGHLSSMQGE